MKKQNTNNRLFKRIAAISASALLIGSLAGATLASAGEDKHISFLTLADEEKEEASYQSLPDIIDGVMSSVVTITTKSVQEVENYYYGIFGYGGYAPREEQEVTGGGSGFILGSNEEELLIATNAHVVEEANSITVGFVDGSAYEGVVKGYNTNQDVAVVAVRLDDIEDDTLREISFVKIGSSDELRVGEQVLVIGNALGYGESATTGIVSAKNRQINNASGIITSGTEDGVNLIQTDAAINPGNSGGPLVNMNGEVVGIAAAKTAGTYVEGMGYAIAIDGVRDTIERLMNQKTRTRLADDEHGVIGITVFEVSEQESRKYRIPMGAYIDSISEGGAAEKAGLPEGGVIVEFDGREVGSVSQLLDYLTYYAPGEEVEVVVQVLKNNTYEKESYTLVLGEQQKSDKEDKEDSEFGSAKDDEFFEGIDEITDEDGESETEEEEKDTRSREEIFRDWQEGIFGRR